MVGGLQCRGEYPLGIFSRRTCHQSRSQRPDFQCPFRICRIRPRQSVATPEARKRPVRGEPHGKLLSFGPDIPSAQLNQLPLGTDQRSSGLLLVGRHLCARGVGLEARVGFVAHDRRYVGAYPSEESLGWADFSSGPTDFRLCAVPADSKKCRRTIVRRHCGEIPYGGYFTAIASISTNAPLGRAATSKQMRAGISAVKNSA